MIVISLLLLFLQGCCCISCEGCVENSKPLPIPEEQQLMTGRWVCDQGDYHEFTADGIYHRRVADQLLSSQHLTHYDPENWTVKPKVILFGFSGDVDLQITPIQSLAQGAFCTTISGKACAKAVAVPKELIGHWQDQGIDIRLREDGYAEIIQPGKKLQSGVFIQVQGQTYLNTCLEVIDLPLTVLAGGLLWQSLELKNVNRRWDEQRIQSKLPKSRSGGGGFDWD